MGEREPEPKPESTQESRRASWPALAVVFGVGLVLRLTVLFEARDIPFFRHLIVDSARYDAWARSILSGDWIGHGVFYQAPLYPYFMAVVYTVFGAVPWHRRRRAQEVH